MQLNLINSNYFPDYKKQLNINIDEVFKQLLDKPQTVDI
jgi:hypothetical protein